MLAVILINKKRSRNKFYYENKKAGNTGCQEINFMALVPTRDNGNETNEDVEGEERMLQRKIGQIYPAQTKATRGTEEINPANGKQSTGRRCLDRL